MFLSDPGSFVGDKTEKESPEELMHGDVVRVSWVMCLADVVIWVLTSGSGELERRKARDNGPACPITTALTASSGVNRDHE